MNSSKHVKKRSILQASLERRILHGLACEWETALWVLVPTQRKKMKRPLFSLRDMKNRWAHWSKTRREISLSRDLVNNHSWDAVREVLHHEMAHQYADEVLGVMGESAHGPTFKKASFLLRANPKATGHYRLLDERLSHDLPSPEDKIMGRIRKLLALAESRNQNEADSAMVKAHQLIERYNIDLLSHVEDRNYVSAFVGLPALRHPREEYHLASLLQDYYFVEGLWVSAFVMEKEKMGRVLEINGTSENVQMASYVYDFVCQYIRRHWREVNKDGELNRSRKTDFAIGVIEGFRSKLESQRRKRERGLKGYMLTKVGDPLLKEFMAYRYPHTRSFRRKGFTQDEGVLQKGFSFGRRMIISKGITQKGSPTGLLIDRPTSKSR